MADPLQTHLGDLVERLDHVAIAVTDIATASRLPTMLGAEFAGGGDDRAKGFRWVQFRVPGSGKIEVLQPLPDAGADHFLVKFLAERGEGLHHITLKVTDLAAAIVRVEEAGCRSRRRPNVLEGGVRPPRVVARCARATRTVGRRRSGRCRDL